MKKQLNIGLVAHDAMKEKLADWAKAHADKLERHNLFGTGTTSSVLMKSVPGLKITALKSGPLGGDQQLGAMICDGKLDMLVFFQDVMTSQPHDVDVKALIRMSTLYDIPIACNMATAEIIADRL
ncbi:methylglyoxal synthase [Sneathiella glossodoripedis]|uniref:methylglyoxal synthase n=1 Tax=Sneathiella glossodoripedis TaxID=418853 RepID=UPI0004721FB0|nr:methylglyoxal synthase [Sneathiella glossodoripedis]